MAAEPSDALVFFGATGDLAYKQIFPSLLGLVRDEGLNIPIIGVAKAGWNLDQLKRRATDSLQHHGGADTRTIQQLLGLLRYVDGDYGDESTFGALREQLGQARRPVHYLAVPPSLFTAGAAAWLDGCVG
jgi:glucose-6-phosphate 1-dehydrogenase